MPDVPQTCRAKEPGLWLLLVAVKSHLCHIAVHSPVTFDASVVENGPGFDLNPSDLVAWKGGLTPRGATFKCWVDMQRVESWPVEGTKVGRLMLWGRLHLLLGSFLIS